MVGLHRVLFRWSHRSHLGGVPPSVVSMGGVRNIGSVVIGPHGGRARAGVGVGVGVDRRTGGHGVTASVDVGRRQSSKGAGHLLVFMMVLYLYFVVVVSGELAFRNAPVGYGRGSTRTKINGREGQERTMADGDLRTGAGIVTGVGIGAGTGTVGCCCCRCGWWLVAGNLGDRELS
jgi:hypothetical protein